MDQVQPLIKLVSNSGTNVDETCVLYMDSQELAKQVKKYLFVCMCVVISKPQWTVYVYFQLYDFRKPRLCEIRLDTDYKTVN